jgi:hypothetical protein
MPRIIEFFKINFNGKITIKLYDDLEKYKSNLISSFERKAQANHKEPRKYQNWMIANTEDGNINMQSLDLIMQQEDYKNYTEEEFCYNACHEFTHLCQQQIKSENPGWFWEALATTLGNPECQHEIKGKFTLDDLNNFDKIDGYGAVYKLGKYMFENYDSDFILGMVKNNDKLLESIPQIIHSLNEEKIKKSI